MAFEMQIVRHIRIAVGGWCYVIAVSVIVPAPVAVYNACVGII